MVKYIDTIIEKSDKYLKVIFDKNEYKKFKDEIKLLESKTDRTEIINQFIKIYIKAVKKKYQKIDNPNSDEVVNNFVSNNNNKIKILWGNCLDSLKKLDSESIDHMVTSPPYYNARDYTIWKNLTDYLSDMKMIIKECYRVLDNHRVFVWNVSDIFDNDNLTVRSVWGKRRLPLAAYFIQIFEDCGFTFIDDIIWDKGQVQSYRHKHTGTPYPFYQYPMNCYEHLLVFHKHRLDKTKFPCSVCGTLQVSGNSQSEIGIQSWECKNMECFERSKCNRGKRFSLKTLMTQNKDSQKNNIISPELMKRWRRDIVSITPVIKINRKGENKLGHTAPFPEDIPEYTIKCFSYKGDKVLDVFGGSFTTAIVANKLGRIGIGCELRSDLFKDCIINKIKKYDMDYEDLKIKKIEITKEIINIKEKPVEEKPVEEKPVEEKPVEEKPVEEKPNDNLSIFLIKLNITKLKKYCKENKIKKYYSYKKGQEKDLIEHILNKKK